jgi:hypothetical protein
MMSVGENYPYHGFEHLFHNYYLITIQPELVDENPIEFDRTMLQPQYHLRTCATFLGDYNYYYCRMPKRKMFVMGFSKFVAIKGI